MQKAWNVIPLGAKETESITSLKRKRKCGERISSHADSVKVINDKDVFI